MRTFSYSTSNYFILATSSYSSTRVCILRVVTTVCIVLLSIQASSSMDNMIWHISLPEHAFYAYSYESYSRMHTI